MTDQFLYKCSRRSRPEPSPSGGCRYPVVSVEPSGAGSGGGPEDGSPTHYHDGTYSIVANQVQLHTAPPMPPVDAVPYVISLFSPGEGYDGRVEVNASQGVRITAGPPLMPPTSSESTEGVEVAVGELESITLVRGMIPGAQQAIAIMPTNLNILGTTANVLISSDLQITLSVAGGLSSIVLTPVGIVLKGPLIQIN
jgi:hypothetical protein